MAKMHILDADADGNYKVVCHINTPAGNNSAGISWQTAGLNSGKIGATVMAVGTGAGQITAAEQTNVLSGTVLEVVTTIHAESGGNTTASLTEIYNKTTAAYISTLSTQLKWYGAVLP